MRSGIELRRFLLLKGFLIRTSQEELLMANESGDLKLLRNFRKLIDLVSADANYKPSNATLRAYGPRRATRCGTHFSAGSACKIRFEHKAPSALRANSTTR